MGRVNAVTFLLCFWLVVPAAAETYFVRPDGGNATQCTGLADAPYYPGGVTGQACAWSHPFWALDTSGSAPAWRIQGGDTLVIDQGSYMLGYGAPNTGWCDSAYPWDCVLPPLPSGPDEGHPTRILGRGWDQGCPGPPELWGTERAYQLLDLDGSSNIVVACLELTDHSPCVESHGSSEAACNRANYPYGPWATRGLYAADSSSVVLKDLNIHGLAHTGILAGRIADWRVENVRVAGNGWAGWDGDLGGESSNTGDLMFKHVVVEWNGCGETYPGGQPCSCWGQTAGGYGDGLGTGATDGNWTFEDCVFRHNTSDGLDLLYLGRGGQEPSRVTMRRTLAYGNAGDQLKVAGPSLIENCLLVSECGFFADKNFTYHVDHCRSGGSALALSLYRGQQAVVVNTTLAGQGDCLVIGECAEGGDCNGSERIVFRNAILVGAQEFHDPQDRTCGLWLGSPMLLDLDYNLVWDIKDGTWPAPGPNDLFADPQLRSAVLSSFDARLQPGSPARDSGLGRDASPLIPDHDLFGSHRPLGRGTDRGSMEYLPPPSGSLLILLDE